MEGVLMKYTNVVKGWQKRWFVMDTITGMLHYYEKEEHKSQKSRGCVYLAAALVSSCEDDDRSFVLTSNGGQCFRLKAKDSKERHTWVEILKSTAQLHSASNSQFPAVVPRGPMSGGYATKATKERSVSPVPDRSASADQMDAQPNVSAPVNEVEGYLEDAWGYSRKMFRKIHSLSYTGPGKRHCLTAIDKDLLLLKATSRATLHCLDECLSMLKNSPDADSLYSQIKPGSQVYSGDLRKRYHSLVPLVNSDTEEPDPSKNVHAKTEKGQNQKGPSSKEGENKKQVDSAGEVEDTSAYMDSDLGGVEEHKSVILHLLSQVKLGMDLTKITLPTFILERRSLLEMFADCMAHPDLFLRIPEQQDAEKRMLLVLEWYLTSFHAGRQVHVAKKPYNPIIGETFHCSWLIPHHLASGRHKDAAGPARPQGSSPPAAVPSATSGLRLIYRAEQVSHHPPVSAFYVECREKKICMNASIWTKSRFMGMSIGVTLVGTLKLSLLGVGEDYIFGLPSAYCRSILSVPWVEMGDKIILTCPQSSMTANINFHTKPFYGGKPHRVTAELKNTVSGKTLCKVAGEWNAVMDFTYDDGSTRSIDVQSLKQWRKRVRPLYSQSEFESRRLWQHVTNALKVGDISTATEHKWNLEEQQRDGENHRKKTQTAFCTQHFHLEGETWVYNNLLGQTSLHNSTVLE